MKTLSLMRRRQGLSREAFRRHYEEVHAPLGYTHYRFRKYVRNHVEACLAGHFDYDVAAEFYSDLTRPQPQLDKAVLREFADDRALFMDVRRTGGIAEEAVLLGPSRTVDEIGTRKFLIALQGDPGSLPDAVEAAAPPGLIRVTLDRFTAADGDRPFDVLLWVWADDLPRPLALRLADDAAVVAILATRSYETPPELLATAA